MRVKASLFLLDFVSLFNQTVYGCAVLKVLTKVSTGRALVGARSIFTQAKRALIQMELTPFKFQPLNFLVNTEEQKKKPEG